MRTRRRTKALVSLGLALVMLAGLPASPTNAAEPGDGLDDPLLEGLEEDLLEDLPEVSPPAAKDSAASGSDDTALDKELGESLGEDVNVPSDDNPLTQIGQRMRQAEQHLAEGEDPQSTRQLQDRIVSDLEKLIEQIRRQQQKQQQSASSSSQPGSTRSQVRQPGQQAAGRTSQRPARDSSDRIGREEVRQVDMDAMRQQLKDLWGHLPERQREQMVQWSVEEFVPKYDTMIRKYFLRLAEQAESAP